MNRIRDLRIAAGLTQTELGNMLNVKDAAISKYENEKIPLTAETLLKLSSIFKVSVDYLLGKDTPVNEDKHSSTSFAAPQISKDATAIIEYYETFSDDGKKEAMKYFQMLKAFETKKKGENDK